METQGSTIQYNRWNNTQDEVSMNVPPPETSRCKLFCNKLWTGKLGIAMKVLVGFFLFWVIFILGYKTTFYLHRCK